MSDRPARHARLHLDQLVQDYLENLQVNLRGFKAAESHGFLEAWVPHDDPTENVIELLELAQAAGLSRLTIAVSENTLARLDVSHLAAIAGAISRRDTPGGAELEMDLSLVNAHAPRRRSTVLPPTAAPLTAAPVDDLPTTIAAAGEQRAAIHPCYRAALAAALADVRHEAQPAPTTGQIVVTASEGPCKLTAAVDVQSTLVKQAGFQGAADPIARGLLETLCRVMEEKPLQECADHAAMAVEHAWRDQSQPPPVRGIVTPDNADPAFAIPQALVRKLLAEFRRRTGYVATQNFFDLPVSMEWSKLTEPQRLDRIAAALSGFAAAAEMEVVGMEGLRRVVVRFQGDVSSHQMQESLVQFEQHVRAVVEPTLHLTAQARRDANVLRMPERKK